MPPDIAPVLDQPRTGRDHPLTRSLAGMIGLVFLVIMIGACVLTLPWTLASAGGGAGHGRVGGMIAGPRYDQQMKEARHLPPTWWWHWSADERARYERASTTLALREEAYRRGADPQTLEREGFRPAPQAIAAARPYYLMGTDVLGRDLFIRCLVGGGISLGIGLCAAAISVLVGSIYGAAAGYSGGRLDAVMMRTVDVLYGLPYVLLVVLLAVASDAVISEYISKGRARQAYIYQQAAEVAQVHGLDFSHASLDSLLRETPVLREAIEHEASEQPVLKPREISQSTRTVYDLLTLLVAIGGVSWLTMSRVVRGQVLSLRHQPFMEAARAMGVPLSRQFTRHLLPNLVGPIVVYATLTVPQAILQESFLSFLGIGVKSPLPSWGNLAADGLEQLNPVESRWWLLLFPCLLLGVTLLALNFVGEGLREALDPKRTPRGR